MITSKEMFTRAKKIFPGGVHSPVRSFNRMGQHPIFFSKGLGATLTSVEGLDFIDFCQSFGPNILGHRHPFVQEEIQKTINEIWTCGTAEPYSLEFGEWLVQKLPQIEALRFVNSGTEAVMSALRLARGITGREKVIKFEGCYHGHVDSMLVQSGSGLAGISASSSAGVSEQSATNTVVLPMDDEDSFMKAVSRHGKDLAALIIEPLPANFGLLPQRKEFLLKLQESCQQNGTLFILDEVINGFRCGFGGMTEKWNLQPDLVTYGKIIGGGFPVGCYGGKKKWMERIAPTGDVYQAGTLSANPITMRAGFATLKYCNENNIYPELSQRTQAFANELDHAFKQADYPLQSVCEDSLLWLRVKSDGIVRRPDQLSPQQSEIFNPLFRALLAEGIYLSPHAYEANFLSLAHNQEVLEKALEKFKQALKRCNE